MIGFPKTTRRFPALAMVSAVFAATLAGCESGDRAREPAGSGYRTASFADAMPAIEEYNARAERFTSLWARASVVVEGRDAEGSKLRERAEGHLQIIPPARFALSLGKLGETNLYFGSNDALYWWFDMTDSSYKTAHFGRHERFTPDKIHDQGLPLHPLDLIEALGITPLPSDAGRVVARAGTEAGTVVVAAPTRRGVRRVTLDAATGEPSLVELIGAGGRIMVSVEMSRYGLLAGLEPGEPPLRMPERVAVETAGFDGEVRISLFDPDRRTIREVAFDPGRLADAYGLDAIMDLDLDEMEAERQSSAASTDASGSAE
jgi:hypothetical protein